MQEIDFEDGFYPLYGTTIIIPENTVFYRGYSKDFPTITERPSYFGTINTALGYAKKTNHTLGSFTNTKRLHLLDYRFMKVILKQLFDEVTSNSKFGKEEKHVIIVVTIALGLSSLAHQITLLGQLNKEYINSCDGFKDLIDSYKGPNLIEKQGVRVAETEIDTITMAFLNGLFHGQIDGFIAPRMKSVFHKEKGGFINPEMIIFNPLKSGIKQINIPDKKLPLINLNELIVRANNLVTISSKDVKTEFYMKGGNIKKESLHSLDNMEINIALKDKKSIDNYKLGEKIGNKWRLKKSIHYSIPPHPHSKLAIFNNSITLDL